MHIEIPQSRELIIMIIAFFELFRIAFRGGGVVIVGTKAQEERILLHNMAKLPKSLVDSFWGLYWKITTAHFDRFSKTSM